MLTCSHRTCPNTQSDLSIRLRGMRGYFLDDAWYCSEDCLESALKREIERKMAGLLGGSANLLQRPLLGLILLESALISREQLQEALNYQQKEKSTRLGQLLQRLGFVQEKDITAALARQSGFPRMSLERMVANEAILRMIPPRIARLARVFPVEYNPELNRLSVVMASPDRSVIQTLGKMLRLDIFPYIGDETLLEEVIDQYYQKESDEGNVEEASFAISDGIASITSEIVRRATMLNSKNLWVERYGDHLWVRMAVETEAYNLFIRVLPGDKSSTLSDTPLRGR